MLLPKTRKEIYQAYLSGDTHLKLPKPVTRDEIILYNACINGAGTNPSWNDLTDKPFGVEMGEAEITWDGDITGLESVNVGQFSLYKVSDTVLSEEQLLGHRFVLTTAGTLVPTDLNSDSVSSTDNWVEASFNNLPVIRSVHTASDGFTPGLWFVYMTMGSNVGFISNLSYSGEVVTPIDPRFTQPVIFYANENNDLYKDAALAESVTTAELAAASRYNIKVVCDSGEVLTVLSVSGNAALCCSVSTDGGLTARDFFAS